MRCRRVRRGGCCSRWMARTRRASRSQRGEQGARGKTVLGLLAQVGEIRRGPMGPRLPAGFV